jgi:hypothetical protein
MAVTAATVGGMVYGTYSCMYPLSLFQDKQTYPNKLRKLKKIVVKKDIIRDRCKLLNCLFLLYITKLY